MPSNFVPKPVFWPGSIIPNLPKVSDYFSNVTREYLVMDFVAGRDLQEMLQDARRKNEFLSEQQVTVWATQLFDALEYLHESRPTGFTSRY